MLGVIARVGSVNGQRVAIVTQLVRADSDDPSEATLQTAVVQQAAETLAKDEIPVFDAGFKIRELQAAKLPRYVVRLAKNFTARRNALPPYKGHGRRPDSAAAVGISCQRATVVHLNMVNWCAHWPAHGRASTFPQHPRIG